MKGLKREIIEKGEGGSIYDIYILQNAKGGTHKYCSILQKTQDLELLEEKMVYFSNKKNAEKQLQIWKKEIKKDS